jgi:hypothetical protein
MTKVFQFIATALFLSLISLNTLVAAKVPDVSVSNAEMFYPHNLNKYEVKGASDNMAELTHLLANADANNIEHVKQHGSHLVGEVRNVLDTAIYTQKMRELETEALSKQKLITYVGIPLAVIGTTVFFVWYMNYKKQFQMGMPMEDDE